MIRAAIDPNILISAFISQRGSAPDRLVRAWREGAFELVVSAHLIAELTDVLGRPKFARQAAERRGEAYVAALAGDALTIPDPSEPPSVSPDRDDDYLFALAAAAGADVIVSGDRHVTQISASTPRVQTPREFADQLG